MLKRSEITIGIDLGDVWSHYCTLNQAGEVVDRGRFRTTPKAIEKWFTDVGPARVAMEAGTHSIWISAQLQELGHEVIVANVRKLRAILTVIGRAIRSMLRSWRVMPGSIRTSSGRSPTALRSWLRTFRANYSDRQLPKKRLQRPALRNLATQ
jgi:transposase